MTYKYPHLNHSHWTYRYEPRYLNLNKKANFVERKVRILFQ